MEKVVKDGEVAVAYSPGYGGGWYSWNQPDMKWLLFHPEIINAILNDNVDEAKNVAERIGKERGVSYVCTCGFEDLAIEWVAEGEAFEISEYDGSESVRIIGRQSFIVA